jgi:serine/threonine protein kinase
MGEALLMVGKTLGHYQITSQLGKGGVGEVFRAKDQTLGRDVAIKVLHEEFAKDADRVALFQREAKMFMGFFLGEFWLRRMESNHRPWGYE